VLDALTIDIATGARLWRASRSFTLMELLATIVILAVLGAFAFPRLVDLRTDAHRASVAMTAAQLRSAITLANIACRLKNFAGLDNLPDYGSGELDFNSACFPVSTSNQNVRVNPGRCAEVWTAVLSLAPSVAVGGGTADYRAGGNNTTCTFTYQLDPGSARTIEYDSATGEVTTVNP
jgi:MSHA pilin protein MshA